MECYFGQKDFVSGNQAKGTAELDMMLLESSSKNKKIQKIWIWPVNAIIKSSFDQNHEIILWSLLDGNRLESILEAEFRQLLCCGKSYV